jgi:hypothetical protein
MNINIPVNIINQLLIESEAFRRFIIDNFISQKTAVGIEMWRIAVRDQFPDLHNHKIAAIKWIRDQTRNNFAVLEEFNAHGFESYDLGKHDDVLSLAGAKRFVESIA